MKYCINDNEGKLISTKYTLCRNCLLRNVRIEICGHLDICDLTHIISKSENISSIFTL